MNVVLTTIFILEITTPFILTGAFPNWSWNNHKPWNHDSSETYQSCSVGQCVKAWECPKSAVVTDCEKESCIYRENGPWICCLIDDSFSHWGDTNIFTSETANNFKRTTVKPLVPSTYSTTEKYGYHHYDKTHKPFLKDSKNRNKEEESPYTRPSDKTIGTKIPNIRVTNSIMKNYNKSTINTNYKLTTNFQDKSRISTSNPNYKRTTNVWDKSRTSTTSPNYKRTTNGWDKSSTPTSSPNYYKRTTNLRDKSNTSTPKPNNNRITNIWDKPYTSTSSTSVLKSTTNLWDKRRTSESRITFPNEKEVRYTTTSPKIRPEIHSTSTRAVSTTYTRRTISTTTKHPHYKKSNTSTKASTQGRNQNWGTFTTAHPSRSETAKPKTIRSSPTRFTTKSTRQYSVTTPLPNVNIHLCGIREDRTIIHRQARDGNFRRNPAIDSVYTEHSYTGSRLPFQRIVGGEEVEPFSWPWVAALYKVTSSGGNRFLSAGSLINENFILTAAHVFTPDDLKTASYIVMLGTHDAQDAVAQYSVSSVLLHPKYEHRYYYNDIALLKLERKVIFNNYIMPICLPSPHAPLHSDKDLLGKNVTVMGWGDDSFGGKSSQVLKEASFLILSRVTCNSSYVRVASNRFPKGITADMLCAGDPKGGKDACQGDSGGPLTVIENRRYTQVGIVSFGYKCGDKEFPGVYTKVAPYLSWIAENTKSVDSSIDYDYY